MNLEFYLEKISLNKKVWVDTNIGSIDKDMLDKIWEMYKTTYTKEGIETYGSFDNWRKTIQNHKMCWLIDVDEDPDPDAFIIYEKKWKYDRLSFFGSDGEKESKRFLLNKIFELLRSGSFVARASKKLDIILKNSDINVIKDKDIIDKLMAPKKVRHFNKETGYFTFSAGKDDNIPVKKRFYGNI